MVGGKRIRSVGRTILGAAVWRLEVRRRYYERDHSGEFDAGARTTVFGSPYAELLAAIIVGPVLLWRISGLNGVFSRPDLYVVGVFVPVCVGVLVGLVGACVVAGTCLRLLLLSSKPNHKMHAYPGTERDERQGEREVVSIALPSAWATCVWIPFLEWAGGVLSPELLTVAQALLVEGRWEGKRVRQARGGGEGQGSQHERGVHDLGQRDDGDGDEEVRDWAEGRDHALLPGATLGVRPAGAGEGDTPVLDVCGQRHADEAYGYSEDPTAEDVPAFVPERLEEEREPRHQEEKGEFVGHDSGLLPVLALILFTLARWAGMVGGVWALAAVEARMFGW